MEQLFTVSSNQLTLGRKVGREVEVPLDVITEATPDAPLLQTDYAQALQRKLASAHGLARKHLSMAALYQK